MLRISEIAKNGSSVTLKLEGRIASEWASLLEEHCNAFLERNERLSLDFSGVSFVDPRGVESLTRTMAKGVKIINCPAFIEAILKRE